MDNHLGRLREILSPLQAETAYDYAILDCPPSLGILMTNALAAANEILVPMQCEYFALEGLSKIVQVLDSIRASGINPDIRIGGILMTMYDARTNLSQQVVEEVRKHFSEVLYQTIIPRTIRLGEAPSFGKAILEYDPRNVGAIAYQSLAVEFLQRKSGAIKFVNALPSPAQ
jgi:chromosome partitioning protein